MNKKDIKKLAEASFSKEKLEEAKVKKIAGSLKREDLKSYIKTLKIINEKRTVYVTIPSENGLNELKRYFSKMYPDKKIVFSIDSSLLTGIKVVDYDTVYELSLKGFLENAIRNTND